MAVDYTARQLQPDDNLLEDYRDLRIELWPDCNEDCDREIQGMDQSQSLGCVGRVAEVERQVCFLKRLE